MFIELTDHLRCPEDHVEQYLVLLPDRIEDRSVREGWLGCPVCGRTFRVEDGALDLGGASPPESATETALSAEAVAALAGVNGPGGYLVLVGGPGAAWRAVAEQVSRVGLVAVNPGPAIRDEAGVSVIRAGRLPLKSRSMRGVVLGAPYGGDSRWVAEAARTVLPGLRVVGEGAEPSADVIEVMATAGPVWVGSPRR
ncbi:MAG TPA: hypothetical protein VEB59_09020 [Gemmatimonadales bacterium]|nr:hypothetical protein [Gemmatimonadales bacterium]